MYVCIYLYIRLCMCVFMYVHLNIMLFDNFACISCLILLVGNEIIGCESVEFMLLMERQLLLC